VSLLSIFSIPVSSSRISRSDGSFKPADLETDRDDTGLFMWPCAREEGIHHRGDLSLHCFMWVVEHSQPVIDQHGMMAKWYA
jgi:hypothetical protein